MNIHYIRSLVQLLEESNIEQIEVERNILRLVPISRIKIIKKRKEKLYSTNKLEEITNKDYHPAEVLHSEHVPIR